MSYRKYDLFLASFKEEASVKDGQKRGLSGRGRNGVCKGRNIQVNLINMEVTKNLYVTYLLIKRNNKGYDDLI